jgi:hypothetical protein
VAYKKKDLEKLALEAITEDQTIVFEDDVIQVLPCGKTTYYAHKLNELNSIKEALLANRTLTKQNLRKKWRDSDNATVQIALYKLIGTEQEVARITTVSQKTEHSGEITHNVRKFSDAAKKIYGSRDSGD